MRLVFMGTPAFALPSLATLAADSRHEIVAVLTQPDRMNRRGNKVAYSPIKEFALAHNLPLYQPTDFRSPEFLAELKNFAADVFIVVAYGRILPADVLALPRYGCLNVHGSLLPRYRGAAPLQRSLLDGDSVTGITIMRLDAGMDTGDMLLQREIEVPLTMDLAELTETAAQVGAVALQEVLADLPTYLANAVAQDHEAATYAAKIEKAEGRIRWTDAAASIHNRVRALHTNPGTHTSFRGKRLKLQQTSLAGRADLPAQVPAGELQVKDGALYVGTGTSPLQVLRVQPEGKKEMAAADFINGYRVETGERFGQECGS